ncbi:GumC family protein [Qipengyuania sp.]|uniref:GumC family protein n=1 Tax=Qipengyuania sp. TaxID=2004515 RepID=UPI003AF58C57
MVADSTGAGALVAPSAGQPHGAPETPAENDALFNVDLRSIYVAVQRNLWPIVGIVGVALILGVVITLLTVPRYVASSRVLIEQQEDQIIEMDPVSYNSPKDAELFLRTQTDVIRSRSLALRVVESEGLADDAAFFDALGHELPTEEDVDPASLDKDGLPELRRELAVELLQENLQVDLPIDSRLVSISFGSASPTISARIANSVATNYIESNLARKFDSSAYAREFLSQQLGDARKNLEQSERDLNQYSREAGLIRVGGQGQNADRETTLSVTNESLVQLNQAASQAASERVAAQDRWESIRSQPILSIPQVLSNSAVQSLISERSRVASALAEERVRHLNDHPNVQALESQVARVDEQIESLGNSIKRSIRLEYEAAKEREESLQGRVAGLRSEALSEQDRGVQYNVLRREAETARALYDALLTRYNQLSATAGAASNNVSIVDLAEPPRSPDSPKPVINMLVALLAGLGVAGLFVFLREQLDDVLRSPDDVERKLGVPMLALIPKVEEDRISDELSDPKSPISEAYQSLLTNLRYSSGEGLPATLTVVSATASEGKSTTAHTLARELANNNRRTLLVDADLRRPTLHRRMEQRDRPGFTSILAGEMAVSDVVTPGPVPNLFYMTALPIPPAPSGLLATADLEGIIKELRETYDHVVFDSPPVLGLSDAPTIAVHVDSVLFVVDASAGKRGSVKTSMRRLNMVGAPVSGVVLTKFDASKISGAYSYYGYDYYDYGSER